MVISMELFIKDLAFIVFLQDVFQNSSQNNKNARRGRAGYNRPDQDQQHCYHHVPTVKPEAATAVFELLMMGAEMPETC
jgi:hypothetical protein